MSEGIEKIYRCTECGKVSVSLGWLHGHIEGRHHGFGPWNIIPNPLKIGNFNACMEKTEVLIIKEYQVKHQNVDLRP